VLQSSATDGSKDGMVIAPGDAYEQSGGMSALLTNAKEFFTPKDFTCHEIKQKVNQERTGLNLLILRSV
jgi:hypothetical protein